MRLSDSTFEETGPHIVLSIDHNQFNVHALLELRAPLNLRCLRLPVFGELRSKSETDLRALVCHFPALIKLVSRSGTELLANFAAENLHGTDAQLELLSAVWEGGEAVVAFDPAGRFYARVLLQPFAEYLASR